jgi:Na+/glutamate symporter
VVTAVKKEIKLMGISLPVAKHLQMPLFLLYVLSQMILFLYFLFIVQRALLGVFYNSN